MQNKINEMSVGNTPYVMCKKCGLMFPFTELKDHEKRCQGKKK